MSSNPHQAKPNPFATPGPHHEPLFTRRDFLARGGAGFGAIALAHLLGGERLFGSSTAGQPSPLTPQQPHFMAKARHVIFLFMEGGPSQMDTFDPKPKLNELAGQQLPESYGKVITAMGEEKAPLLASRRTWNQYGQSGLWVSDWLPHLATCADDLAVIRSCVSDGINHAGGVCQMNTGKPIGGRPSLGSWVTYGLGTENQNLPAFVVLLDTSGNVVNGSRMWGTGFMPAVYQGTRFEPGREPIPNLHSPKGVSQSRQRAKLDYLQSMNRRFIEAHPDHSELEARIRSYELAFRMQAEAPDTVDLSGEPQHIRDLYGMDEEETATFGRNCLMARRLVERGVRFVQLYHGTGSKWDSHSNLEKEHAQRCREMDKPVAGLLKDLKQRGLLEETLVVWGGEFGRTPMSEKGDGRDHNPTGFTMWFAGGGVKGGQTIGATDDLGLHAVEDRLHVNDLHATICYLLGIDHTRLTYLHKGRPERVDANEGHPFRKIVG